MIGRHTCVAASGVSDDERAVHHSRLGRPAWCGTTAGTTDSTPIGMRGAMATFSPSGSVSFGLPKSRAMLCDGHLSRLDASGSRAMTLLATLHLNFGETP